MRYDVFVLAAGDKPVGSIIIIFLRKAVFKTSTGSALGVTRRKVLQEVPFSFDRVFVCSV